MLSLLAKDTVYLVLVVVKTFFNILVKLVLLDVVSYLYSSIRIFVNIEIATEFFLYLGLNTNNTFLKNLISIISGNCDNCTSNVSKERDLSCETALLLGVVNECGGRWGLNLPINVLRGSYVPIRLENYLCIFIIIIFFKLAN